MRDIRSATIYHLVREYAERLAREGRDEDRPVIERALDLLEAIASPEIALPIAVETFLRAL